MKELECHRAGCGSVYRIPYPDNEIVSEQEYLEQCAHQFGWTSWEDSAGTVTHYCTQHFPDLEAWKTLRKRW